MASASSALTGIESLLLQIQDTCTHRFHPYRAQLEDPRRRVDIDPEAPGDTLTSAKLSHCFDGDLVGS